MLLRAFLLSAAAMTFVSAAAPAAAQEGQVVVITGKKVPPGYEPVTQTVSIADLNLMTTGGVQEMEERVAHAVAVVCPMPAGTSPQYEMRDYDACRQFALDGARPQMDRAIAAARAAGH